MNCRRRQWLWSSCTIVCLVIGLTATWLELYIGMAEAVSVVKKTSTGITHNNIFIRSPPSKKGFITTEMIQDDAQPLQSASNTQTEQYNDVLKTNYVESVGSVTSKDNSDKCKSRKSKMKKGYNDDDLVFCPPDHSTTPTQPPVLLPPTIPNNSTTIAPIPVASATNAPIVTPISSPTIIISPTNPITIPTIVPTILHGMGSKGMSKSKINPTQPPVLLPPTIPNNSTTIAPIPVASVTNAPMVIPISAPTIIISPTNPITVPTIVPSILHGKGSNGMSKSKINPTTAPISPTIPTTTTTNHPLSKGKGKGKGKTSPTITPPQPPPPVVERCRDGNNNTPAPIAVVTTAPDMMPVMVPMMVPLPTVVVVPVIVQPPNTITASPVVPPTIVPPPTIPTTTAPMTVIPPTIPTTAAPMIVIPPMTIVTAAPVIVIPPTILSTAAPMIVMPPTIPTTAAPMIVVPPPTVTAAPMIVVPPMTTVTAAPMIVIPPTTVTAAPNTMIPPTLPPVTTTSAPMVIPPAVTASPVIPPTVTTSVPVTTTTNAPILLPPSVTASPVLPPTVVVTPSPIVTTTLLPATAAPVLTTTLTPVSAGPVIQPMSIVTPAPITTPTLAPQLSLPVPVTTNSPTVPPVQLRRFDITLDFDDASVPTADHEDFIVAAQRWEEIVIGDVEDVPISELTGSPPEIAGCSYPTDTGFVDDLYMCIYYQQITIGDGVIGLGGYIYTRNNGIPVSGFIQIDPDEVEPARQLGYFNALILHEFGHAIGVGTAGPCPSDNVNSMANFEFQQLSQCSSVLPIDSPGCGHFAEECFGNELMTPAIGPSFDSTPLSRLTVGWANDVGYEVNYDAADPFDVSQLSDTPGCNCNRRSLRNNENNYDNVRYLGVSPTTIDRRASNHTSTTRQLQQLPPTLSNDGYNTAMESGMTYLYEQIMKRKQQMGNGMVSGNNNNSESSSSSVIYVGDQFVWVYVRENDHIHSVLVRSTDAEVPSQS